MDETKDPFLAKRLVKYDEWLGKGMISFASKVVPVSESLEAAKWVIPSEQALAILREASFVALWPCECRSHYGRCDKPRDVCFLLDSVAEKFVTRGLARPVTMDEAAETLRVANENGLVHMGLHMPDHKMYAFCSCCSCCCHELRIIKEFGRPDILARSDYVAVTDAEACIHCGACVERCVFGARVHGGEETLYDVSRCLGCGLCVTTCPTGAISMEERGARKEQL